MPKSLRAAPFLYTLLIVLGGCGGGGGGGAAPAAPQASVSVSSHQITVSATTSATTAPAATLQITASNPPSTGIYIIGTGTTNGISNLGLTSNSATTATLTITFKVPATLIPGVYIDTVRLQFCTTQACSSQISGSPQTIAVRYTVTLGDPSTATPDLMSLSPATATAGGSTFTIIATGTNFAPSSVVEWNGIALPTTYVSYSQVTAQVSASDIANPQTALVDVTNQASGGGTSSSIAFDVTPPLPVLTSLMPASASVGGSPFVLTVAGTSFATYSVVQWNGAARTTQYISPTELTAQITAADIATAGSAAVTVSNQAFSGGVSNPLTLPIVTPPLSLTTISPVSVTAGGVGFAVTVFGSGFNSSSTVQLNGSARATTLVSTTELLAQITAADIASVGTASITVFNSGASGGTSSPVTLTIAPASIDSVAYQINPQHTGAVNFATILPPSSWPTAATGTWSVNLGGIPSYALIAGGKVFVTVDLTTASVNSQLVALDQTTGSTVWGPVTILGRSNAAFDAGSVFVLSDMGQVQAFDAASGSLKWSTALPGQFIVGSTPIASGGLVYVGGSSQTSVIWALDESTGVIIWSQTLGAGYSPPAISSDGAYIADECAVYALRPATGESIWTYNAGCPGSNPTNPSAVANGVLYANDQFGAPGVGDSTFNAETGAQLGSFSGAPTIGSQGGYCLGASQLQAVSLTTLTTLWTFAGDGSLWTQPVVVNGYVFTGSGYGNLYGVDAATGAQVWHVNLGAGLLSGVGLGSFVTGLAAGDGLLLVPTSNNTLTAFRLSNSP